MRLSPSSLGIFKDCQKCFWLDKNAKISRPRGIFPSLPGGIDRILKEWANGIRSKGGVIPTLITDKGVHKLFPNEVTLKKWQNWRSGLEWEDGNGNSMIGALDEVLMNSQNAYVPTDFKTKGSATNQADVEKYYQRQLDCYALLLSTAGAVADYGFILSHYPIEATTALTAFRFEVETFCLSLDVARAKKLFNDAIACLNGPEPPANRECEYCLHFYKRQQMFEGKE